MGYNPHEYKYLFPKGLFDYPNEKLTNWGQSHKLFALNMTPLPASKRKIASGLFMKTGRIKQGKGFSNYLIFEIDPSKRKLDLSFLFDKLMYPVNVYKKLNNPLYLTNMGYFYLTDEERLDPIAPPKIRIGNLVISKGKLINLPILNRSAFVIYKDNSFDLVFLKAKGKLKINSVSHNWVGSKTGYQKNGKVVIYNSSNINIELKNDPIMGPSRKAKKIYLEPSLNKRLVICKNTADYTVTGVTKTKVLLNDKDMILEVDSDFKVKKGDKIVVETVDSLDLGNVRSAVSIGPMLFRSGEETRKQVTREKFGHDMANPNNPHRKNFKLARGCLVKLKNGKLASILIDGIPQAGDIYPGVTLRELAAFVKEKYPDYLQASSVDPSSTLKGIYRKNGKIEVFGNLHYIAHKRKKDGSLEFWPNGRKGRKINSMLVIT